VKGLIHISIMPEFKAGDPPPSGYSEWHEWAEIQHKAGLRSKQCGWCGKWRFPQEFSTETRDTRYRIVEKNAEIRAVDETITLCLECAKRKEPAA
jgi:hypothetical protein